MALIWLCHVIKLISLHARKPSLLHGLCSLGGWSQGSESWFHRIPSETGCCATVRWDLERMIARWRGETRWLLTRCPVWIELSDLTALARPVQLLSVAIHNFGCLWQEFLAPLLSILRPLHWRVYYCIRLQNDHSYHKPCSFFLLLGSFRSGLVCLALRSRNSTNFGDWFRLDRWLLNRLFHLCYLMTIWLAGAMASRC